MSVRIQKLTPEAVEAMDRAMQEDIDLAVIGLAFRRYPAAADVRGVLE